MKRMRINLREAGDAATEVYRLERQSPEEHLYFDVYTMRKWTLGNLSVVGTFLDWGRADHLITSGAVDPDRIKDHTILATPEPIIIGVNVCGPGNDQVLDGAHRYVTCALAAAAMGLQGQPVPMPAYFLEPEQWKKFLIPNFIAKALRFDENYVNDSHKWTARKD
ncbi:hypothetical protein [Novosphingobium mathurense]|nr:hypothetical protein [Novosphingobium mathurense]